MGLEDLHRLAGDHGPPHAADQLFGFAREHDPGDDLDPAGAGSVEQAKSPEAGEQTSEKLPDGKLAVAASCELTARGHFAVLQLGSVGCGGLERGVEEVRREGGGVGKVAESCGFWGWGL